MCKGMGASWSMRLPPDRAVQVWALVKDIVFCSCARHLGCVPLGLSGSVIQDLSGSWCIKGTGESTLFMDSLVLLMHHDPDRSWITDPDPDHPKGMHPLFINSGLKDTPLCILWIPCIIQENLFYVTVNNKFVIGREIKKGKGEVCITTDNFNLNAMFFRLRIWWRMTNSSISKA